MRTLYFECAMGAAGDMLMAALLELCPEKETFLGEMNTLLPGLAVESEQVLRRGMAGTHIHVLVHGEEEGHEHHHEEHHHEEHHHEEHHHEEHHHGRSLGDIAACIAAMPLSEEVRERATRVYGRIAEAEAAAHGVPVGEVHFHEVGAVDAVADVVGVCRLVELLQPDRILASPVTVGYGTVHTAHGPLPVPAPATAALLKGVPIRTGDVEGELCTPTGAALLTELSAEFGPMPDGVLRAVGVGCGTKEFPRANCLRAFLVDSEETSAGPNDRVTELRANLDDMTGEALAYAAEQLFAAGALDVSFAPLTMKKDRPGVLLLCLCRPEDGDRCAEVILRNTSTMGVRREDLDRYALHTETEVVETPWGSVGKKTGRGYGITKSKVEYEDAAAAARRGDVPLAEVLRCVTE